ncbi:hypothetical protein HF086_000676, partial [Spodoptera exigua]
WKDENTFVRLCVGRNGMFSGTLDLNEELHEYSSGMVLTTQVGSHSSEIQSILIAFSNSILFNCTISFQSGKYGEGYIGSSRGIAVHVRSKDAERDHTGCQWPLLSTAAPNEPLPSEPWIAVIRRGSCNFEIKVSFSPRRPNIFMIKSSLQPKSNKRRLNRHANYTLRDRTQIWVIGDGEQSALPIDSRHAKEVWDIKDSGAECMARERDCGPHIQRPGHHQLGENEAVH